MQLPHFILPEEFDKDVKNILKIDILQHITIYDLIHCIKVKKPETKITSGITKKKLIEMLDLLDIDILKEFDVISKFTLSQLKSISRYIRNLPYSNNTVKREGKTKPDYIKWFKENDYNLDTIVDFYKNIQFHEYVKNKKIKHYTEIFYSIEDYTDILKLTVDYQLQNEVDENMIIAKNYLIEYIEHLIENIPITSRNCYVFTKSLKCFINTQIFQEYLDNYVPGCESGYILK